MRIDPMSLDKSEQIEIGAESLSVLRVCDVFAQPHNVSTLAETQKFKHINPHYPGIRAPLPDDMTEALCAAVSALHAKHSGKPKRSWSGQAWFSLVTTAPERLTPIQRMPHFDGLDGDQLAVMIYLNRTSHGGTGFYRHCSTGFETLSEARYPNYKIKLEADVRKFGVPDAAYVSTGDPMFERIANFDAEFNSMIVYPGVALHSGQISPSHPLSADPTIGRLTINGFFRAT